MLKEKLLEDLKNSMKERNALRKNVVQMVRAAILQIEKDNGIEVDDNKEVNSQEVLNISEYLVHQGDLIYIVNELFNAGADAISINGKRIVNTTSILCDGNIIRINDEIVGVPIEIKAIGYPANLYYNVALRPGGYLKMMADDGVVVNIEKSEDITIPKYEGIYKYEYIVK